MGTATGAMRHGQIQYYLMNAFFFDVLVKAECIWPLVGRSNLHFNLVFEEKTIFGGSSKYLLKDLPIKIKVLNEIAALSIGTNSDKEYQVQYAIKTNKTRIMLPRPINFEIFKLEMLNILENLERIFKTSLSPYGSVMELSFSYGVNI